MSSSNQEIIRLRQRLAQNNIIVEFTHRFAATLDASEIQAMLIEVVFQVTGAKQVALHLQTDQEITSQLSYPLENFRRETAHFPGNIAQYFVAHQPIIWCRTDATTPLSPLTALAPVEIDSYIALPLKSGNNIIGILEIFNTTEPGNAPQQADLLVEIAGPAGLAIANGLLYQSAQHEIDARKQMEKTLRDNEERWRFLLNNLPGAIYRCKPDKNWTIEYVSPYIETLTGYPYEVFNNHKMTFGHLFHPDDAQAVTNTAWEAINAGAPYTIEYRIIRANGSVAWFLEKGQAIYNEKNEPQWLDGVLFDITATKKSEEQSHQDQILLRSVIDSTPDFIFIKDTNHRYRLVNKEYADALQLQPEDFIGKNDLDMGFPEEIVKGNAEKGIRGFWEDDDEVMRSGQAINIVEPPTEWRGQTVYRNTYKTPFYDANNQVAGILGFVRDVTSQKVVEQVLSASQSQLTEALTIAQMGSWEYDVLKDQFTFTDQLFEMMHTTAAQEGGYYLSAAQYVERFVYPDDAAVVGIEIGKSLATTDPDYQGLTEHRIRYRDGGVGYIVVRFKIEKDEEGRTCKIAGANQDITLRKQTETLLAKQARELEAVAQISAAAATIQATDHLLQTVVDLTKGYFNLYHTHIYLLNEVGDTLILTTGAGDIGRQMVGEGRTIPLNQERSLVARAARNRQAVIVNDVQAEPGFLSHPLLPQTRAEMAVPLLVGGRVLGVMDVQGETSGRFTTQDANIFSTLASQVSIALQNARSFEQYEKTLAELNTLTRRLVREGWDTYLETSSPEIEYTYGVQPTLTEQRNGASPPDLTRSLSVQGEVIGQLALLEPDAFEDDADAIVSAVAERLSLHLESLRLTEQTQQALAQTEALYTGSGRVVRASSVQEVMNTLVEFTALREFDRTNIILFDRPWINEMPNTGTVMAVWEKNGQPPRAPIGTIYQARQFPSIQHFSGDHVTIFSDTQKDERMDPNLRALMVDRLNMRSLYVFPFVVSGQWWGFFTGQSSTPLYLTEEQVRQISSLTDQAATVIQSLRLFEQATDRANQLTILNDMARDLTIALDVDSTLETVYYYTERLTSATNFYVALYNEETQEISFPIVIDEGKRTKWATRRFGNEITDYVLRSGQGVLIENGVDTWLEAQGITTVGNPMQSWLGFPLKLANVTLGIVALQSREPFAFTSNDYSLLNAVASQGGIAIQNARLFEQTQHALAETETLFEISQQLNAANDPQEVLTALAEPSRGTGVSGVDLYFIETDNEGKPEWVELKALLQMEGTSPLQVGARFYLPDLPISRFWLSQMGEPIFVDDVRTESRLDESSRLLLEMTGVRSAVYLPLTLAGRWVALVGFRWLKLHTFAQGDKRLYQSMAAQAAVAINNYQLFNQAQARARQLELLNRMETELSQATDEAGIVQALLTHLDWGEPFVYLAYLQEDNEGRVEGLEVVTVWNRGQFVDRIPPAWSNMNLAEMPLMRLWQENPNQMVFISDVQNDPRVTEALRQQAIREGNWQATILLPLRSGGRWQAILGLSWEQVHAFSGEEMFFLERLQEPVAAAIAGRRAFLAQQQSLAETEALYRATRDLNTANSYDDILFTLREHTLLGDNAQNVSLNYFDTPWTANQKSEWINVLARWSSLPAGATQSRYPVAQFPAAETLLQAELPVLIQDVEHDVRLDDNTRTLYARRFGAKSTIFVPLKTGGEWIGYINALYQHERTFGIQEVQRVVNVASQAAAAVQNFILAEKREQALQETATLYQATADINASRRYYEIIKVLRNYTLGKQPVQNVTLNLFDRPWSKGQIFPWVEVAERLETIPHIPVGTRYNLSDFPSASLILSQEEPIFIADLITDPRIDAHTRELYHDRMGVYSIIFIPLVAGGQWLGFVDVFYSEVVTFEQVELRRMLALTGQAAVATQNLRSVEVAQQRAQEAQARREESELLYNLSAQLTASNTLEDVLRIVAVPAGEAGARSGVLALFAPDSMDEPTLLDVVAGWSAQKHYLLAPDSQWLLKDHPQLQFLLRYPRSPLYVHDTRDEIQVPSAAAREFFASHQVRSLVCLPLNIGRRRLGIILLEWDTPRTFSNVEQRLYHSIAGQASVVVDNRQLLVATQTRAAQLDKLSRIETALSLADTEEEILLAVLTSCNVPFSVSLQYIETDRYDNPQFVIVKQVWMGGEFVPHSPIINQHLPLTPDSRIWIEKPTEVMLIDDVDQDMRINEESRTLFQNFGVRTMAVLPLRSSGRWQGLLSFTWSELYTFSLDERFLWRRLLDALGAVVASRRALLAQQAAREEIERLYIASRRLNETTDLNDMLGTLVMISPNPAINRAVLMLFDYDEHNELTGVAIRGRWYAGFGREPFPLGTRYTRAAFPLLPIVLSPDPLFLTDVRQISTMNEATLATIDQLGMQSLAILPLWVGPRQIGCVLIETEQTYEFTAQETEPYTALAGQLAIAVENQRLFDQTRQQLSDLTSIQQITSLLTAAISQDEAIKALLPQIAKAVGVEVVNLYILLDEEHMLRAGQYASIPVPEFPENEVMSLKDYPLTREVITTRQPITRQAGDARLTAQSQQNLSGRTANATIPLIGQDKVMGVLSMNSYRPDYVFTAQSIRLLQTLAEQSTIALERVRLLEETTRRARREQVLREITAKVRGASDVETVMRTAVHEVGRILGRRTFVHLQKPETSD